MPIIERLSYLNRRGLIHAPDEPGGTFLLRCREALPTERTSLSPLAKKLFDIEPDWVSIVYENRGLHFWEGACTWIEKNRVTLQLNKTFETKRRYFGYTREEVIAHELVHVVRGNFEEPIFEEVLAYQTASSWFRRFFGPLFRSSKESTFFLITLILFSLTSFFSFFEIAAFIGVSGLLFMGAFRLFKTQLTFSRAKKKLSEIVEKERTLAVMLRLTDREIIRFSRMKREEILCYAKKMRKSTFRWQQIFDAYFRDTLEGQVAENTEEAEALRRREIASFCNAKLL